ncbi:hypothetical protein MAXJ12_24777 [Mesorhizobium alhagi CCNWXJ12-2]|uniref:Uncharacterized protein n=1 Tax=Mesorhizobium alhagi CCNWXJ12-2 TaxID=1107882 RepID=H0HXQ6_9HYPH|nr:hypothetical protein MAXJ12_24777 [Mesorhizobium alhagi CCNWXJ12-2]
MQDGFGPPAARLTAVMSEVRHMMIGFRPGDKLAATRWADATTGEATLNFGDMRQPAIGFLPIDKLGTIGTIRLPRLFLIAHPGPSIKIEYGKAREDITLRACAKQRVAPPVAETGQPNRGADGKLDAAL